MLEFCTIESPLAQPRNAVLGQLIGSIIGVALSKGLALAGPTESHDLQWLLGAVSCGCTIVVMGLTGTIHPPAGATALLAVTDESVTDLGWMLVPLVLLSSALMQMVALLVNNIQRRFPLYWWTPGEVGSFWSRRRQESSDCEMAKTASGLSDSNQSSLHERRSSAVAADVAAITITKQGITTAAGVRLSPEALLFLDDLRRKL